jgi:signal transduction histidine kinase
VGARQSDRRGRILTVAGHEPAAFDESGRFSELVADLSTAFIRAALPEIDNEINRSLQRIAETLDLDRSTIAEFKINGIAVFSHGWVRDPQHRIVGEALDVKALLPWTTTRMLAGETVVMPGVDSLPAEAAIDRESFKRYGPKSNVMAPIEIGGVVVAAVGFAAMTQERSWPPKIVQQLQRVAEIFGYAFERKRTAGEMLRLRNELTHVSRVNTMGELAASLAHELNQPLAAILNNAEAIQNMLQAENPELAEITAAIADIIQDDTRAGETIGRLRAIFRRDELKQLELDLGKVIRDIGPLVQSDAVIRGVTFKIEVDQDPVVFADRVHLQQAIVNLVLNAFDAVSEVAESARKVTVRVGQQEPDRATVSVHDSGKGIAAELMPRIFESFFTTKLAGMGMGLMISRSIIEAHGGRLAVSSTPGRGATFEISLPSKPGVLV